MSQGTFQYIKKSCPYFVAFFVFLWVACAGSDPYLEKEYGRVAQIENQYRKVEKEYILVLAQQAKFPLDGYLKNRGALLRDSLLRIEFKINDERKNWDHTIKQYEATINENRVVEDEAEKIKKESINYERTLENP